MKENKAKNERIYTKPNQTITKRLFIKAQQQKNNKITQKNT